MDCYLSVRYGLFNGGVFGSDCTARNGGVVNETRFGKVMEDRLCPICR